MWVEVVGVGVACLDHVLVVPSRPARNRGVQVQQHTLQGGGKVPTAMVALSRLGWPGALLGPLADDVFGSFLREELRREGLIVREMQLQPSTSTPFSTVLTEQDHQSRTIFWHPGTVGNCQLTPQWRALIAQARYLLVSEDWPMCLEAVRIAKQGGVKVVYDADHPSIGQQELLAQADIVIASEEFMNGHAPGATPQEFVASLSAPVALVTLGARGGVGRSESLLFRWEACQVEVVDTLGAGDVFHGAFVAGLLRGQSTAQAAEYASAAAGLKCAALGGRAGIPNHQATLQFLQGQR